MLRGDATDRRVIDTYRNGSINVVLCRDCVRDKQVDHLVDAETGVGEAVEDLVYRVRRLRNEQVGRCLRDVRAACEELDARATGTVRDTDGTGELNAIETLLSCAS